MSAWLLPIHELTPMQRQAIQLPCDSHHVVFGPPGSGKTQVLVHRAAELKKRFCVKDTRFRILVYTNTLKQYIKSALDLLTIKPDAVTTYDDWCRCFHIKYISPVVPWDHNRKRPDFAAVRQAVMEKVFSGRVAHPLYDFILVDEGQDLESEVFQTLRRVTPHITVCFDNKQQIYERGSTESSCLAALGLRQRSISLEDAYRCSPSIALLASALLDNERARQEYLQQVRVSASLGETPLLFYAGSIEEEKTRMARILRERLLVDQRIGVLFPLRKQVYGFAQSLKSMGINVETQESLDFTSSLPKLITYHSAKGLMFDSVLLPRLVQDSFTQHNTLNTARLLFVGITRASKWVYLSTCRNEEISMLHALLPLANDNHLIVQPRHDTARYTPEKTARVESPNKQSRPTPKSTEDSLDFL